MRIKQLTMEYLITILSCVVKEKKKVSFFELFPIVSREYIVATLLAILEMARNKELKITQEEEFSDIVCEVCEGE